jgi:hypothetical protein
MKLNQINVFEQFVQASTEEEYKELRSLLEQGGYSLFSQLLAGLKDYLLICEEALLEQAKQLVDKGKDLIPNPVILSPSWERIWADMDRLIYYKGEALRSVPSEERDGEWQIIMDNPYTNEGISCYPSLSFKEAAYLYGYFRKDLKKNEYIRLQKITNLLMSQGE